MKRVGLWLLRQLGSAARLLIIGTVTVAMGAGAVWAANYALTQGTGTTFGSIVVSAVNYAQQLVCDPATPSQCIFVGSDGSAQVILNSGKSAQVRGTTTSTDTGAHTIIAAGAGSLKNYITDLECFRTDAGATAIVVTLSDAAATVIILPGSSSSGSGVVKTFLTPLATAAATAFTVTSATGVSTLYCSAQGFQAL